MGKRKLQIGVMGSAADTEYSAEIEIIAQNIGREIAKTNNITIYGAEKDSDSLSTAAARGAKEGNGLTVGITYGKGKNIWDKDNNTDVIICSGMERGGGREFVLVNSCDGLIAVSGGSGTMNEMLVAYQLHIPIVVVKGTGGWADKMADQYFDTRERIKAVGVNTAEEAVAKIIELITSKKDK